MRMARLPLVTSMLALASLLAVSCTDAEARCRPVPPRLATSIERGLSVGREDLPDTRRAPEGPYELEHLGAVRSGDLWYVSGHVRGRGLDGVDAIGTWAVGTLEHPGPIHSAEGIARALSRYDYGPLPAPGESGFNTWGVGGSRRCSQLGRMMAEGY